MPTPSKTPNADFKRADDFVSRYANNAQYESSLWDLKLIFGQLDQSISSQTVIQHTAVTIPWLQVKLLVYFLQINLIAHEASNGRVMVAPGIVSEPPIVKKEEASRFGWSEEAIEQIQKHYRNFMAANPEATPKK